MHLQIAFSQIPSWGEFKWLVLVDTSASRSIRDFQIERSRRIEILREDGVTKFRTNEMGTIAFADQKLAVFYSLKFAE